MTYAKNLHKKYSKYQLKIFKNLKIVTKPMLIKNNYLEAFVSM